MNRLRSIAALVVLGAILLAGWRVDRAIADQATIGAPLISAATLNVWKADTTCFVFGSGTATARSVSGSAILLRVYADSTDWAADTLSVDSIAVEVFLYAKSAVDSAAFSPVDLNDSNHRLDGWLCTSLDSTALVVPTNLTPITGAAAALPKYPNEVSSRVVYGKPTLTAFGVAIGGANLVLRRGEGAVAKATQLPSRWFHLPLTDAYGAPLLSYPTVTVGVLNRHPRKKFKISAWLIGPAY